MLLYNKIKKIICLIQLYFFSLEISTEKGKKKIGTIVGISNWNEWRWPIEGEEAGYILARALPHTGSWNCFSPEKITKIVKRAIEKPQPIASRHTNPTKPWTVPIPRLSGIIFHVILESYFLILYACLLLNGFY